MTQDRGKMTGRCSPVTQTSWEMFYNAPWLARGLSLRKEVDRKLMTPAQVAGNRPGVP